MRYCYLLVIILMLACCTGCTSRKETAFSIGAPIPLGETTITVSRTEARQSPREGYVVIVFFSIIGPKEIPETMLKLGKAMKIRDSAGKEHPVDDNALNTFSYTEPPGMRGVGGIIPADYYRAQQHGSREGELRAMQQYVAGYTDWVALFTVPETNNLSLVVKNFNRKKDQPRIAVVELGR